MKKITFLALHLGFGGVEKAIISQANILCEKFNVEILSTYKLYDTPPFEINSRVKVTYLIQGLKPNKDEIKSAVKSKKIYALIKEGIKAIRILYLRKATMIKAVKNLNSDIIISTRFLFNDILCKYKPQNAIIIAQEHRHHNNDSKYISELVKSVKDMDYFMPVSRELTDFYSQKLQGLKVKCRYIPHFLDTFPDATSDLNNNKVVAVGRLSYEKGFDELPEIFAEVLKYVPTATLDIVGDGDQVDIVKQKIIQTETQNNITLHGYQDKSYINNLLKNSSVFVMPSREESFGIVLLEAQSYGIPTVAFDCATGAREIIDNSVNGFLISGRDKSAFAKTVARILTDYNLRKSLGTNARENSEKYKKDIVKKQWFDFYDKSLQ